MAHSTSPCAKFREPASHEWRQRQVTHLQAAWRNFSLGWSDHMESGWDLGNAPCQPGRPEKPGGKPGMGSSCTAGQTHCPSVTSVGAV